MADGSLYSIDTLSFLLDLPATKLLVAVFFLMRGLVKAVEAVRKFNAEGKVPFNKGANIGASMFCALNVAVVLFLAVLWLSALAEILSLAAGTRHYASAYTPLVVLLAFVEIYLLYFIYRGLWTSLEKNGDGLSWRGTFARFREKMTTYHTYLNTRGMSITELVLLPLGAAGFVSATFWLQLFQ